MSNTNAHSVYIDVLAVIDTENIKQQYRNPSMDPNNPTSIEQKNLYLIGAIPSGIKSGQGTANLNFNANPGDEINFRGVSVQQNSDDAIILYRVQSVNGDRIFNNIGSDIITRGKAVMPDPNSSTGMPAVNSKINFVNHYTKIVNRGTAGLNFFFALYTSDDGTTQKLFGYFFCDGYITNS